ncbi:MAG TPA: endonuclease NucS domain-containing protein [Candidatus Paceibacterota bacterium]|nr:endonuclease NucS domain-containing protein [Candidatus Paceibacterota bacterium]
MANLFRITASNPEAYQHYIDTIERGFPLDSVTSFLDQDQIFALRNIYGDKLIRAWGATAGSGNIRTWHQLNIGDPILIYRKGNFEYYAFVTFKIHNKDLAKHLWRTNPQGETWEYVYFLDGLVEISVPLKIFNELMGFNEAFRPYGFAATESMRLNRIENKFGSVIDFLNYLREGKWVDKETQYPAEVKENIIKERLLRPIGNTTILEANLENLIVDKVSEIEPGLNLIGRQVDTKEVGRLDLLCEDKDKNLVVIELKRAAAGPSIIEQIQRYMGWAIKHRAQPGQRVRGIIIAGSKDTALEYAVSANPLMEVKTFNLSIQ